MRTPFAVRNGAALNSGSSEIRSSFAIRLPEKSDRLRSPSFTLRPRMIVSCRSIPGRNVFAFTKRGIKATATTSRPINASRIFVGSFRVPPCKQEYFNQPMRREVYDDTAAINRQSRIGGGTMRAIAKKLKVGVGTLYRVVPGRSKSPEKIFGTR